MPVFICVFTQKGLEEQILDDTRRGSRVGFRWESPPLPVLSSTAQFLRPDRHQHHQGALKKMPCLQRLPLRLGAGVFFGLFLSFPGDCVVWPGWKTAILRA